MNTIKLAGLELAANSNLFACVELAMDLSETRAGEVEVYGQGIKLAGFTDGQRTWPPKKDDPAPRSDLNIENFEAWAIQKALERTGGNVVQAARLVGLSRTTFDRKLRELQPVRVLSRAA